MATNTLSFKKEKIVIIESSESFGKQLLDTLKADGYESVFLIKNGEEGLKNVYDILPHLIILDVTLPDTDGYQILKRKQAEPLLSKIPVILLSTSGAVINMNSIPRDSNAQIIISPPTKPVEILKNINEFFDYPQATVDESELSPITKKKILWIEDDKLIGTILSKKLVSSGFDLVHAMSGEEAIKSLESRVPDVIVIDLLLPGMGGFDILQKIKDNSALQKVPRMVLSNLSKSSDIEKAKDLGANKFLVKASTSLDQIVVEIKSLCK
ncbi:MAG: response regulator [Candidatus Paceibacterota bacterium]